MNLGLNLTPNSQILFIIRQIIEMALAISNPCDNKNRTITVN